MASLIIGQTNRGLSISWRKTINPRVDEDLSGPLSGAGSASLSAIFRDTKKTDPSPTFHRYVGTGTFSGIGDGKVAPQMTYLPSPADYTYFGTFGNVAKHWYLTIQATWPNGSILFSGEGDVWLEPAP
jgi:hypothetical protein